MVTITTDSEADAVSVERELVGFGASLAPTPRGWDVTVRGHRDIGAILTAVERCLGANSIPSVSVTIADRTYLLAPAG